MPLTFRSTMDCNYRKIKTILTSCQHNNPRWKRHCKGNNGYALLGMEKQNSPTIEGAFEQAIGLHREGNLAAAEHIYRQILAANPQHVPSLHQMATLARTVGQFDLSINFLEQALQHTPNNPVLHNDLACNLKDIGDVDDGAYRSLMRAVHSPIGDLKYQSNLILCQNYRTDITPEELKTEAEKWAEAISRERPPLSLETSQDRKTSDKIKVGYLSGDLNFHPVGFFWEGVLQNHDRDRFEIHVFATTTVQDDITQRISRHTDFWHTIDGAAPEQIAAFINEQKIDILIELAGHGASNNLKVMALKPAPVLLVAGGHFGTSGLACLDGLITDSYQTPTGTDQYYTEPLIRLPDGYVCYRPPDYAPDVCATPALETGHITFGCFNNLAKLNAAVIDLWSKILHALPDSKLYLKTTALKSTRATDRLTRLFADHDISPDRFNLESGSRHPDLLACYNKVDIALDPFPYNGGLTTLEALWMGVPVVTLVGDTFPGRHSLSHLSNCGLADLAMENKEAYLKKVLELTSNIKGLNDLRQSIRPKMQESPLLDHKTYTQNLEAAYLDLLNNA